jgi:hypothetical protein
MRELVTRVGSQAIKGDDLVDMLVALVEGSESFRSWLHSFVDESLAERGVEADGLERKAIVYKESIELAERIGEHVRQICETAAAVDIVAMEREQLHRLLPSPYDTVQQALSDRAEANVGRSHRYEWAILAHEVAPWAKRTGAIDPEDLDPQRVAEEGNMSRLLAAVPALKRIVRDGGTPLEQKKQKAAEIMNVVKDRSQSPEMVRQRFRLNSERIPAERFVDTGRRFWTVGPMSEQQEYIARRVCKPVLDFNAPWEVEGQQVEGWQERLTRRSQEERRKHQKLMPKLPREFLGAGY